MIQSLSCRDCEQAKWGFCDAELVGLEVWDCMVERVLAETIDKGNFPGGPGATKKLITQSEIEQLGEKAKFEIFSRCRRE